MTVSEHIISGSRSDAARARLLTGSAFINRGVSVLTGKPLPGEPPFKAPRGTVLWALSLLGIAACAIGIYLLAVFSAAHLALLPVTLPAMAVLEVLLVGRLRAQQVVFAHHAIHGAVAATKRANALIASLCTALTISQNPALYWHAHAAGHHLPTVFTTPDDADAAFLLQLGFQPGRERRFYWRLFLHKLIDPQFHLIFAIARLRGAYEGSNSCPSIDGVRVAGDACGCRRTAPVPCVRPRGPFASRSGLSGVGARAVRQRASVDGWPEDAHDRRIYRA